MKKTFKLSHPKIKYPRMIESAKNEAKKYLKRERNKVLPKGFDFWDFSCKFGADTESAQEIHVTQINEKLSYAETEQWQSFYLEIIAVPANRVFIEREEEPEPINDGTESTLGSVRQHEAADPFEDDQYPEDN